jgi:hypothetical protein
LEQLSEAFHNRSIATQSPTSLLPTRVTFPCAHHTISVDSEAAPHRAMREALEVLRAALHPSMAHRSGAHRLWPSAPPRGAGVAGGDLSAVSGLHPRETRAVAASAAREPPRAPGPLPPERR